ncbi:hypothetical protein CSKR_112634 [Clonorchis sinensis]|uniref:Uncharacterized protein n=1 Tax=Clonorchis sinensis TaxID=79923 RepID=A0A3R7JHK1_CLOSI|nr:hypothetical protein CSKR_112634 [Clonorchis sinensis]
MFYLKPNCTKLANCTHLQTNLVLRETHLEPSTAGSTTKKQPALIVGLFAELGSWIANVSSPIEVSDPPTQPRTDDVTLIVKKLLNLRETTRKVAENSLTANGRIHPNSGSSCKRTLRVSTNLMFYLNPNCVKLAKYAYVYTFFNGRSI